MKNDEMSQDVTREETLEYAYCANEVDGGGGEYSEGIEPACEQKHPLFWRKEDKNE